MAAPTIKIDIYGSRFRKGFANGRDDYAERRFRVSGTLNTNKDYAATLEAIQLQVGNTHQDKGEYPLRTGELWRTGPASFSGRLIYRRPWNSVVPQSPMHTLASTGSYVRYVDWFNAPTSFDADGLPNGQWRWKYGNASGADPNNPPVSYKFPQHGLIINLRTVLNFSPANQVAIYPGRINSGAVTWGGMFFEAGEILCRGFQVDPVEVNVGNVQYNVTYQFAAVSGGFRTQFAEFLTPGWSVTGDVSPVYECPFADFLSPGFPAAL